MSHSLPYILISKYTDFIF